MRGRKPPRAACTPSGPFAAPAGGEYACRCGEPVFPVRAPERNDWTYVTAAGERSRDDRPAALIADPAAWWARLSERNIGAYSNLKAALDLGFWQWFHLHDANVTVTPPVCEVPWCCDQPMWASPDGWVCRVAKGAPVQYVARAAGSIRTRSRYVC